MDFVGADGAQVVAEAVAAIGAEEFHFEIVGLREAGGAIFHGGQCVGGGADYGMSHSTTIWLIDRSGRLRALMPFGHSAEDFAHDVRHLMALQ